MALSTFDAFFKSDDEKATNGVPVQIGTNDSGDPITIWVAELGNPNHQRAQRRFARQLEQSRRDRKLHNEIVAKIVAEAVLIKWEGFVDEQGATIEPTQENKVAKLKSYERFMNIVLSEAGNHDNFTIDEAAGEADTEKN